MWQLKALEQSLGTERQQLHRLSQQVKEAQERAAKVRHHRSTDQTGPFLETKVLLT